MEILQTGNKVLRKKAEKIPSENIVKKEIQGLIHKMKTVLRSSPIGIGLAAPQIGASKTVFIVSKYVLDPEALRETKDRLENKKKVEKAKNKEEYLVFINPKIVKISKKKALMQEGCLSVRGKFGWVKRATNLTIEAYDENGNKFIRGAGGLLAHVIQHEVDHLEGTLFTDKAEKIEKEKA